MRVGNVTVPRVNNAKTAEESLTKRNENSMVAKDEYLPSTTTTNVNTYLKPDADTIAKLRAESERTYSSLRQLVEQLLKRQGMTYRGGVAPEKLEIDNATIQEAEALVAEGGEFSAENVSDRIVEFAKNISGGDKSKLAMLKGAITRGFEAAASALGGQLPEVSLRTYELVMEKLAAWENEE